MIIKLLLIILMSSYKRINVDYTDKEIKLIRDNSIILNNEIIEKINNGLNILYENQIFVAKCVNQYFKNLEVMNIMIYSRTQAGKTGCMTGLIREYVNNNLIPIENIFIITALSDKQWKLDTINRMPNILKSNILHRPNINSSFFKDKTNLLIIMDEIQIAAKVNQTIYKLFNECNFYNLEYLANNDIKIVQFSATPDGNIIDIEKWENNSKKIFLETGKGYIGTLDYINQKRLFQYKNLEDIDNVKELIKNVNSFDNSMYHLIRTFGKNKQNIVIDNFKKVFDNGYLFNVDLLGKNKYNINEILVNKPIKHTFIFYCEILRCAKTQCKTYIGISYERISKFVSSSTIIQGAIGRLTGYDDNGKSICFTDINSIIEYEKLLENDMNYENIVWNSNTTIFSKKTKETISVGTFNNIRDDSIEIEPIINKFNSQYEMIIWFKDNLKPLGYGNGPNIKYKENGFYKVAGATRKGKQILSIDKIYKERRSGLNVKNKYRSYACYKDVMDKDSVEWWLIYYK